VKKNKEYIIDFNDEDFELFSKILKLVYEDVKSIIYQKSRFRIIVKENGDILFNFKHTKANINEHEVIKHLFNLHYIMKTKSHLFTESIYAEGTQDQEWFKDYQSFKQKLFDAFPELKPLKKK
jgi:hypothetical protein